MTIDYIGDTRSRFSTTIPCLYDTFDLVKPGHGDCRSTLDDDNGVGVRLSYFGNQLIGAHGEMQSRSVVAFRLPVLIQADRENHSVNLPGERNGVDDSLISIVRWLGADPDTIVPQTRRDKVSDVLWSSGVVQKSQFVFLPSVSTLFPNSLDPA